MDYINFQKPTRYIGEEINSAAKKITHDTLRICLCFPDLYELGMSNLGLRIIYGLLNSFDNVFCERAFLPDIDFQGYLLSRNKRLVSLESKTPLSEFDVLGINFNYELNYTNFLKILELAGIPLFSSQRGNDFPLIIAGGTTNPEPIADFADIVFLGEFEEKAELFINALKEYRKDKESLLKYLSSQKGFYIPKFYDIERKGGNYTASPKNSLALFPLRKVYVKNLDNSFYPESWIIPYTKIIHDRLEIEIARGCPNRCNFCQARGLYYPYRERSLQNIVSLGKKLYKNTGYEEISLASLSVCDYSHIDELLNELTEYFSRYGVSIALPSLRAKDIVGKLAGYLSRVRRTGLTIAIESASRDIQQKINKVIDTNELLEALRMVKTYGYRRVKLYFMFGFPGETIDDLDSIVSLIKKIKRVGIFINLSINVFVPKPFSSFEYVPMEKEEELTQKKDFFLRHLPRGIRFHISPIKTAVLEAMLSRGDRSFSRVIHYAYKQGALFDSYRDRLKLNIWEEAFSHFKINPQAYLREKTDNFPWSHLNYHDVF